MGLKENIRNTREEKISELANKQIRKIERRTGRKIEDIEMIQIFELAEKKVKKQERKQKIKQERKRVVRNRIIAILGALGIAVGGYAMLNSGDDTKEPINNPAVESTNMGNKNKDFRDEIKTEVATTVKEEELINEILQEYNSKLPFENRIGKDDVRSDIGR